MVRMLIKHKCVCMYIYFILICVVGIGSEFIVRHEIIG